MKSRINPVENSPMPRNTYKPDRIDEIVALRDAYIFKVYKQQYTIKEIGVAFNMSYQNVWKIVVREGEK